MQCFIPAEIQCFILFHGIEYKIYTFEIVMKYAKPKKISSM